MWSRWVYVAVDVSGGRTLRNMYDGVVNLQNLQSNLPTTCIANMGSKIFLLLGLSIALALLISSEVAARELAETAA